MPYFSLFDRHYFKEKTYDRQKKAMTLSFSRQSNAEGCGVGSAEKDCIAMIRYLLKNSVNAFITRPDL